MGGERGVTLLEAAVGISIVGSLLAIFVPTYVRGLHGSRLVEATDGLARIGERAIENGKKQPGRDAFPASAPLTPAEPPRGKPAVSDDALWQHPTWVALDFRPVPSGVAHSFAFAFAPSAGKVGGVDVADGSSFVATAHGDLDGDGVPSTFEIRGASTATETKLEPGVYVEAELE